MFPDANDAHSTITEDAIADELENEEQDLVKELVALSTQERVQAIRDLPKSFEEKQNIRSQVLAFKSAQDSHELTCCADFTDAVSLSLRRLGYGLQSAHQVLQLWQGTLKEIGGTFGSSVLSYFLFLKWLLLFNLFSFLVNFGFITIPLLVLDPSPNVPANVSFRGLELLTGAGYFNYTVMYYGSYSNETLPGLADYDMRLAYFFTISAYMVLCGIVLIFSMARSFLRNYVLVNSASSSAWQLLCSWDFSVINEKAVRQLKNNLRVQLKESLSEKMQRERLTVSELLKQYGVHLGSWLLSTGLAFGCAAGIYFLCQYEQQHTTDVANWSPLQEAKTLLVPFMVSLINLVVPLFYSLFNKFEIYSSQSRQIYVLVIRNVLLRMFILGVLCYYWMQEVANKFSCWESFVGQALYRLVIFDFLFLMLGSFFGEFLSNVIGTRFLPQLGVPEFDVARNVIELIYAQTLSWLGIFFSPLLPVIQILKFLLVFYLKKVSITMNCQPPRRTGRAAQMQTILIALLFFPFFVGALSIVAYSAWSLTPSKQCGPFRGLNNTFSVVDSWIDGLEEILGSDWVVWIYRNIIRSEVFYFFITILVMVVVYITGHVIEGRKLLIVRLRRQIVNEGKDKTFLLEKLQKLHNSDNTDKKPRRKRPKEHKTNEPGNNFPSGSSALVQALLAQRTLEEEKGGYRAGGGPIPSDNFTPSALIQVMLSRQSIEEQEADLQRRSAPPGALAQAMLARRRAEQSDHDDNMESLSSSAVMRRVMQRAEEPRQGVAPAGGSSALIQAMLARQQAQNEFDDGY